ncbi:MAG: hypothetical protein ACYTGW_15795 [Planctomycetota bacterium]
MATSKTGESTDTVVVGGPMGARRYCLFCFATLPDESNRCASCHQTTRPLDCRVFWNRNPRILSIEQTIKILTVVLTALVVFLFFTAFPTVGGTKGGWFFLLPLLPAIGVWKTASALTRVQPYFQVKVFWLAIFVLLGIVVAFVSWFLVTIPLVCVAGVLLAARDLRRWKRGLIAGAVR